MDTAEAAQTADMTPQALTASEETPQLRVGDFDVVEPQPKENKRVVVRKDDVPNPAPLQSEDTLEGNTPSFTQQSERLVSEDT